MADLKFAIVLITLWGTRTCLMLGGASPTVISDSSCRNQGQHVTAYMEYAASDESITWKLNKEGIMLSDKHTEDVCLVYQGAKQCRYLDGDPDNYNKFYCRKKTSDKKVIDEMADEYIAECAKNGTNALDGTSPIGDNCTGYLCFKDLLQGYDVEDE